MSKRQALAALTVMGAVLSGTVVASAVTSSPASADTTVHACVAKTDRFVTNYYGRRVVVLPHGAARVVGTGEKCKSWEVATAWAKTGKTGKTGAAGVNGKDGVNGSNGKDGVNGSNGRDGVNGSNGRDGVNGSNGRDGAPGKDGATGPIGLPGEGVTTAALAVGDASCPAGGVSVANSAQTVFVCNGTPGKDGADGAPGLNGRDGVDGERGPQGLAGLGVSVAVLPAGDAHCPTGGLSVTDATSTSYVCNGVAGKDGADGTPGRDGVDGPPGAPGRDGVDGAPGLPGPAGPPGAKGDKGDKGDRGDVGPQGPAGNSALSSRFGTDTSRAADGPVINDCVLGSVYLTAGGAAQGLRADGRLMSISQNSALFSLLGTQYGGDGQTTFALPDLRAVAPNGLTYMICDQGIFPSRY